MALKAGFNPRIVFNDAKVAGLTGLPSGEVYQWVQKQGKRIANAGALAAPSRTGHLRRTIRSRVTRANATSTTVTIRCTAAYAEYVHNGTGGKGAYIFPDNPTGYMVLYSRPDNLAGAVAGGFAKYYLAPAWQVHGQDPFPFLLIGLDVWAATVPGVHAPHLRPPVKKAR